MKDPIFEGVCTALVTPFTNSKEIDVEAFKRLINRQLNAHINAILILGTTGEASTIKYAEREVLIKTARKNIPSTTKLIVGTGSNDTDTAIKYTQQAESLGADAVLVVTPYYNKCSQKGAILHYKEILNNSNIPLILYNVPSRTGFNLDPETVCELSKENNVIGLKEANSNEKHIDNVCSKLQNELPIYSGNDDLNIRFLEKGAKGFISVLSNVLPNKVSQLYYDYLSNPQTARTLSSRLSPFANGLFLDVNPIPTKYVLSKLGLIEYSFRLPMCKTNNEIENKLNMLFNFNNKLINNKIINNN